MSTTCSHRIERKAKVLIGPTLVRLDPPVPMVEDLLTYRQREFEDGGTFGFRETSTLFLMAEHDDRGRLTFPVGLWPRVKTLLESVGYAIEIDDKRQFGERQTINSATLENADAYERAVLEAIAPVHRGQIEVHGFRKRLRLIGLICQVYPKARILVGVHAKKRAWQVCRHLEEAVGEKVRWTRGDSYQIRDRLRVATLPTLALNKPERGDFLLLPDADRAVGTVSTDRLATVASLRTFGFVAPRQRRGLRAQLRLEAICGPVIYTAERPRTPVYVSMVPVPPIDVDGTLDGLTRKRAAIWGHGRRNRLIARIAQAVANLDLEALRHYGVTGPILRERDAANVQAAILVESTEHGRALLAQLPGWHLVDGADHQKLNYPAVVTQVRAAHQVVHANLVIRATGDAWPLRLKGFPPPDDGGAIMLIDLADDFDAPARTATRRRRRDYEMQGWEVEETPTPTINTIERTIP